MRFPNKPIRILSALALVCLFASPNVYAQESNADLMAQLELMQQQIDALKQQIEQTQSQASETDAKVEAVAEIMESDTCLLYTSPSPRD